MLSRTTNKRINNKSILSFQDILRIISIKTNYQPKLYGQGYKILCPSHNDKEPSLSIKETSDGKTLLYCFNGCHIKDICNSLGIEIKDLFTSKRHVS